MTIVLSTKVDVFDGFTEFSAKPGLITLTDDDRVTIAKINPSTGESIEMVMTTSVRDLSVRSYASNLRFSADGVKKMVGFSFGARSVRMFGLLGILIGQVLAANSPQADWVAELSRRGAAVSGGPLSRSTAIILLCLLVAVLVTVIVLGSLAIHRS